MDYFEISPKHLWVQIGSGGHADVYMARNRASGRYVAVKVLREAWDPVAVGNFEREIQRQSRCGGPTVVNVLGFNFEASPPYAVLELMRGSLRDRIKLWSQDGFVHTPRFALLQFLDIVKSVASLHKSRIIHRDLKPENILVDEDGRLRISDLGVARTANRIGYLQTTGFRGTPYYAAPEQDEKFACYASDFFPLGLILYEMLTGDQPTRRGRLSLDFRQIPIDLVHLIQKLTQHCFRCRLQDANRLLRIIRGLLRRY